MPGNFFRAAEIVSEADPNHEAAKKTLELAEHIDLEIEETKGEEEKMLRTTGLSGGQMNFVRSPHVLLMHDLQGIGKQVSSKTKKKSAYPAFVQDRLDLMERVYRSYFGFFASRGYYLEPPKERLQVVLFQRKRDFQAAVVEPGRERDPDSLLGVYILAKHTSMFFENRTQPFYAHYKKEAQEAREISKDRSILNRGDFARLANTFDLFAEIEAERLDQETLSHELTHHLAAATGLQPNFKGHPHWMNEGLAAYFEASKDAGWSGVGAIQEDHLKSIRRIKEWRIDGLLIDYLVQDQFYRNAADTKQTVFAYSMGWALTHFLMEKYFDKLIALYKRYADGPRVGAIRLKDTEHLKHFDAVFPRSGREALNRQFLLYINSLKTDVETVSALKND
jgi:hypothetical protein